MLADKDEIEDIEEDETKKKSDEFKIKKRKVVKKMKCRWKIEE